MGKCVWVVPVPAGSSWLIRLLLLLLLPLFLPSSSRSHKLLTPLGFHAQVHACPNLILCHTFIIVNRETEVECVEVWEWFRSWWGRRDAGADGSPSHPSHNILIFLFHLCFSQTQIKIIYVSEAETGQIQLSSIIRWTVVFFRFDNNLLEWDLQNLLVWYWCAQERGSCGSVGRIVGSIPLSGGLHVGRLTVAVVRNQNIKCCAVWEIIKSKKKNYSSTGLSVETPQNLRGVLVTLRIP